MSALHGQRPAAFDHPAAEATFAKSGRKQMH